MDEGYIGSGAPKREEPPKTEYREFKPEERRAHQEAMARTPPPPAPKPVPIAAPLSGEEKRVRAEFKQKYQKTPPKSEYKEFNPGARKAHQEAMARTQPGNERIRLLSERRRQRPAVQAVSKPREEVSIVASQGKLVPEEKQVPPRPVTVMEVRTGGSRMAAFAPGYEPKEKKLPLTQQGLQKEAPRPLMNVIQEVGAGGARMAAYAPGYSPEEIEAERERSKSRTQRIKERAHDIGVKAGIKAREVAARASQSRIVAGVKLGAQEAREGFGEAVYKGGRQAGRLPLTIATHIYNTGRSQYESSREAMRLNLKSGEGWATPLVRGMRGGGGYQARPQRVKMRGTGIPFVRVGGRGRMSRYRIPRGTIKTYWSKKLKKLARQNIRRYGEEEGIARTRQIAALAGWKMQ